MRRTLDLAAAGVALMLFGPVLAAVACVVRCCDGSPVLYRGQRVGLHGRLFQIFKFRTMRAGAGGAITSTAADDPRITRFGRFLRATKLDELPQLFNVLRGDMSIVGPRPQVAWAVRLYTSEQRALLSVRPGLTDLASLRFRDEGEILRGSTDPDQTYLDKIAPEKIRLGLLYVRSQSLLLDVRIVAATAWALVGGRPERMLRGYL